MRIWLFLCMVICGSNMLVNAQWDPAVSQYMNNQMSFNPAYAGVRNTIYTNMHAKKQWVGIEGSPSSYFLSIDAPINKTYNAVGGSLFMYKAGPVLISNANFVFAHLVKLRKKLFLSYGLSVGAINYTLGMSKINVVNEQDPLFQGENINQLNLDMGVGGWLYGPKFFIGLSVPHILQTNFRNEIEMPVYKRHFYLTGGYNFNVSELFVVKPSVLFRVNESLETLSDINALIEYKSSLSLGLSYRIEESLVVMTNIWLNKNIGVGYAYDLGSSNNGIASSSHEVSVSFESFKYVRKNKKRKFPKKKKEQEGMRSLRYF